MVGANIECQPRPIQRDTWVDLCIERAKANSAYIEFDGREKLPDFLQERLTKPHIAEFESFMASNFQPKDLDALKGKTIAVSYTKFGHGHKHQALDFSLAAAHILKAKVVLFDPIEALPSRERHIMEQKRDILKMLQERNPKIMEDLRSQLKEKQYDSSFMKYFDKTTDKLGMLIAEMALSVMPAQGVTVGESGQQADTGGFSSWFLDKLMNNPKKGVQLATMMEMRLTERSVACATAGIAGQIGAEAIITTHPNTIRALTKDTIGLWIPKKLWKPIKHAMSTVMTLVPDPGYDSRSFVHQDPSEWSKDQHMESLLLTAPFAIPYKTLGAKAPWFKDTLQVVADQQVADSMHRNWDIDRENLLPIGTVADTITAEQFEKKWAVSEKRILLASNGNGSNIKDAITALRDVGRKGSDWLRSNCLHIDVFLADFSDRVADIESVLEEYGLTDQAEIIDYTKEYFNKHKVLIPDPNKRIHIAYGVGDASGSELKQLMQRWAHLEIRTAGENAITGAKVGTLELCTPTGGPNEVYNTIWGAQRKVIDVIEWPLDPSGIPFWEQAGFTKENGYVAKRFADFTDIASHYLDGDEGRRLATNAYMRIDKHMVYTTLGILARELLAKNGAMVPDRQSWIKKMKAYQQKQNDRLSAFSS